MARLLIAVALVCSVLGASIPLASRYSFACGLSGCADVDRSSVR